MAHPYAWFFPGSRSRDDRVLFLGGVGGGDKKILGNFCDVSCHTFSVVLYVVGAREHKQREPRCQHGGGPGAEEGREDADAPHQGHGPEAVERDARARHAGVCVCIQ